MKRNWPLVAALAGALVVFGCTVPPEEPILDQFFIHSRLRDKTALAEFSTVILEPTTEGIVTTFHVVGVTVTARDPQGEPAAKDVTVKAPVKLPDGQVVEKTFLVAMERRDTGWKITGVRM
jgi:hypothetical protein